MVVKGLKHLGQLHFPAFQAVVIFPKMTMIIKNWNSIKRLIQTVTRKDQMNRQSQIKRGKIIIIKNK